MNWSEQSLLDPCNSMIEEGSIPKALEKRNETTKSTKNKLWQNNTFAYLTRMVEKLKNQQWHRENMSR